ncbi:hypothetical protein ACLOJK_017655 [Asimina triloba]
MAIVCKSKVQFGQIDLPYFASSSNDSLSGYCKIGSFVSVSVEMSTPSSFPVRHKSLSLDIKGNKTDIVLSSYDDHFLVSYGSHVSVGSKDKQGTDISVILQSFLANEMRYDGHSMVTVVCHSGNTDVLDTFKLLMLAANASSLCSSIDRPHKLWLWFILSCGSSRPLVLSLGLKDHTLETLKGIVSAVIDNRLW